ncbi:MAG TPA: GNAT family N-acetyltransferase [Clostridiales bacterium UBA8960]|jgi:ribosomal-protein-alanine N-acetyltransferase|nr:GNAT family N-acetyltransferase [Clostridiales bacterium UBA8960]
MENIRDFSTLKNEPLCFMPMQDKDAAQIHEYASDPVVSKFIGWPLMKTLQETRDYVGVMMTRESAGTHFYANVALCGESKIIGTMMVFNLDWHAMTAEIGYVFHKSYWGKGYGALSVKMTTDFMLESMGFKVLFANVVSANIGSSRILEKNGYVLVERKEAAYQIEGESFDQWCYERRVK